MKKLLRRTILYLNLLLAVLLVLAYLSPGISPEIIWVPSFLGLAYPYILLLNVSAVVFWLLFRKKEFLISLLVILLGWNTLSAYIGLNLSSVFRNRHFEEISMEQRKEQSMLKVMSFNVRAFDRFRWAEHPDARHDILEVIRASDPDIICFQEFFGTRSGRHNAKDIYRSLGRTPYRHSFLAENQRGSRFGTVIFSHYPIVQTGRLELGNRLSNCIFADISVAGDTLRVYNSHLQSIHLSSQHYQLMDSLRLGYNNEQLDELKDISSRLRSAFVKRAAQADLIAEHISDCPYPLILCGDFNDTPVSYTYKRLSKGLDDAFTRRGWGIGRTYNGKFPSFRIDYILFGRGLEALHFARRKVNLSDHYPITAYLEFQ